MIVENMPIRERSPPPPYEQVPRLVDDFLKDKPRGFEFSRYQREDKSIVTYTHDYRNVQSMMIVTTKSERWTSTFLLPMDLVEMFVNQQWLEMTYKPSMVWFVNRYPQIFGKIKTVTSKNRRDVAYRLADYFKEKN